MAGMMTFGAYLPKEVSIPKSVLIIVTADTLVALVAGLVIFPAVFKFGLDPAGGAGLVFQTLPVAFAQMPGGAVIAVLFFVLLTVGGITSMVGLVEPVVSWLEEHQGFSRHKSTLTIMASIAVLSVLSVLSYNLISDWQIFGKDLNGALDYLSNQMLLPLGGFLLAVFVGWSVSRRTSEEELEHGQRHSVPTVAPRHPLCGAAGRAADSGDRPGQLIRPVCEPAVPGCRG